MSENFVEVLLDGTSILDNIASFRLLRQRNSAMDTLTLRLADFSLYASFDFGVVPLTERIHVGTSTASPKIDGSTVGTTIFTSPGSDFTAEGFTTDDILFIINSTVAADIGGHEITVVGTTTLTTSFTFGTASAIKFIVLKNQGRFFVEKPDVIESEEDIAIPSLWGRCGLARLTDPFVNKLTKTFPKKQNFSDLVAELVTEAGMDASKVIIDIDDFIIPGNLLTISNQLPLDVLINVARKTNGYIRCQKTGDLIVRKDIFHFAGEPIVQVLGDDEIRTLTETTDFPEFGNRVLVRSVIPESSQDVRVRLSLETACTRGDGRSPLPAEAIITDIRGNPVANGTVVDWTSNDTTLFKISNRTSLTRDVVQTGEEKRASSLFDVSTDKPIRDVLGVFLKMDVRKLTNFFTGGSFIGTAITLGRTLPFSDSLVTVDYIASGIAINSVVSVAGAEEGGETFISAAVGRIRDSVVVCIRNTRNIFLTLDADPAEFNLCLPGAHTGTLTAVVRDNGTTGQLIGISWELVGLGTISTTFTIVRNTFIASEFTTSSNLFTVNTKYEIASVVGVFRADDGNSGTNHFTNSSQRNGSFNSQRKEITLGTNLPFNRDRVEIIYTARAISRITYDAPLNETGPSVVQVIAKIDDGTQRGITEAEEILLNFRCPDDDGDIAGVDPVTGLPTEPAPEPDCSDSTGTAGSCNILDPSEIEFAECVCELLTGSPPGTGCPSTEEECREMCQEDFNFNGRSSLLCDVETSREYCKRETGLVSFARLNDCLDAHGPATVDKCTERCLEFKPPEEETDELRIEPGEGVLDCVSGQISFEARGGSPPYTWTITNPEGTPTLQVGQDGFNVTVIAPANTSTLPDNFAAYHRNAFFQGCGHAGVGGSEAHPQVPQVCGAACGPNPTFPDGRLFCTTTFSAINIRGIFNEFFNSCTAPDNCQNHIGHCQGGDSADCVPGAPDTIDCSFIVNENLQIGFVAENRIFASGAIDDKRSPADIAAGCVPCAISMADSILTLTDSDGNEVFATIRAEG